MSLILEALKKSEHQRRLGETPTLGTPVLATRRRRSLLPLLALAIVAALGVGYWLLREAPSPVAADRVAQDAAAPPASAQAPEPAAAPIPAADAQPKAATAQRPARRGESMHEAAARASAERRAAEQEKRNQALDPADKPGSVAELPVSPLTAGPRNVPPPATPATPKATPPASIKPVAPAPADAPAATPGAAAQPPAAAAPPASPAPRAAPAVPLVWELPYSIRKDLPALPLTLHMYSSVPAERFVVVAGERYVEGDEVGDGVVLAEIRADGIVLDFKGQRFLYPRDGR